jgi:hypothetical protein
MRVRDCQRSDRWRIARLGHTPDVIATLCPTPLTRLAWRISRTRVRVFVAEEPASEELLGSVQFVRSRIDDGTWMFGHWKVPAGRRGEGIGGVLLREALRLLPQARRIYSLVDLNNTASIRAHVRYGFEAGTAVLGGAPLGALSTIGPPAPAVHLERLAADGWGAILDLYRSSMGPVWMRLFPRLDATMIPRAAVEPPDLSNVQPRTASIPGGVMVVSDAGDRPAFLVRRGARTVLFTDPGRCDAGLLARVASQVMALGAGRDDRLALRGLPRNLAQRPGPIRSWVLMGAADVARIGAQP